MLDQVLNVLQSVGLRTVYTSVCWITYSIYFTMLDQVLYVTGRMDALHEQMPCAVGPTSSLLQIE
jgi:hypothetical protein